MSNRLTVILVVFVLLAATGFGVYNFLQTHEYKTVTTHLGFKAEARRNPLYASRLFLKRMGIDTKTKNSIQDLNGFPSTDTILLIDTNRSTLSNSRTLELIDWVKSGGHVIAKTTKDWKYSGSDKVDEIKKSRKTSPDPLQRYLGIRTGSKSKFLDPEDEVETIIEDILGRTVEDSDEKKNIEMISLKGVEKKLGLNVEQFRSILVDKEHAKITEQITLNYDTFLVRQKVGNGLITMIADMSFIENKRIEKADHAEILWQLIHGLHKPLSQPKAVWLIHNDEMPSLWYILWNKSWAFILSLLLLFGAWLLVSTHRFGPMIPKQSENRRSLNEHISSSGNFYWRYNNKQKLINSSRKALLQRLSKIHPGWEQRTKEEQAKLVSEQIEIKPKILYQILFSDINNTSFEQADTFTQLIKDIEMIRTKI